MAGSVECPMISESDMGEVHVPSPNVSRAKRIGGIVAGAFVVLAVYGLAAPSQTKGLMSRITGHDFISEANQAIAASCDGAAHTFNIDDTSWTPGTTPSQVALNQLCGTPWVGARTCTGTFCSGTHSCNVQCGGSTTNQYVCKIINDMPGINLGSGNYWLNFKCVNGVATQVEAGTYPPSCFPGEAMVHTDGGGETRISELRVGDRVLSAQGYETVLGFLHQFRGGSSSFLTVSHSEGEFRATENHLVFVAEGSKAVGDLRVGEQIFVSPSAPASQILEVRESKTNLGIFSPLTASGTVIVDGVVASIYGQPSMRGKLTHGSAHAAFFPVRAYHALGLTRVFGHSHKDELHPFAELLFPLQFFLSK